MWLLTPERGGRIGVNVPLNWGKCAVNRGKCGFYFLIYNNKDNKV